GLLHLNPLVMIVHRHGQGFLGVLLSDAVEVEPSLDFGGLRDAELGHLLARLGPHFLVQDVFADQDATVADVNARSLDELFDFRVEVLATSLARNLVDPVFQAKDFLRLYADVRSLALYAAPRLMNHDARVGQRVAFALGAGGQQHGTHAGRLADAIGVHIAG